MSEKCDIKPETDEEQIPEWAMRLAALIVPTVIELTRQRRPELFEEGLRVEVGS